MTKAQCMKASGSESGWRGGLSQNIENFGGHGMDIRLYPESNERAIKSIKQG